MYPTGEIITAAEALTRIGLEDLIDHSCDWLVEWTGYPKPFACGHTETRGYGPLGRIGDPYRVDSDEEKAAQARNDSKGSERAYQQKHRINQAWAGGAILFRFARVAISYPNGDRSKPGMHFYLQSSLIVTVQAGRDALPDDNGSVSLRIGWTA